MAVVRHSESGTPISGKRLQPGDVFQRDDVYDSSDGTWRRCPTQTVGHKLGVNVSTIWVRPDYVAEKVIVA